jgi:hypothetical protein
MHTLFLMWNDWPCFLRAAQSTLAPWGRDHFTQRSDSNVAQLAAFDALVRGLRRHLR